MLSFNYTNFFITKMYNKILKVISTLLKLSLFLENNDFRLRSVDNVENEERMKKDPTVLERVPKDL